LRILGVAHFVAGAGRTIAERIAGHARNHHVNAVLVDSRTASAPGGTGVAFDWVEARRTVFADAGSLRLIAAGGLNPENVVEAIATLRPWGIDVVSGVEAAPGRKDAEKVRAFLVRARVADWK
jgi:phosphoribosylanthranilate isomerase